MNDRRIDAGSLRGIVLGSYDFGDSSKIIDLLTLGGGRISVMAKGARRPKSRLLNLCEPFVEGDYNLTPGRQFEYIKDGELIDAHLELRSSVRRLTSAAYCCELARTVLLDNIDDEVFYLLKAGLSAIESASEQALPHVLAAYVFKLASFIGFRPTLARCVICGRPASGALCFDTEQGGVICAEHRDLQAWTAKPLSSEQHRELMRYIAKPLAVIAGQPGTVEGAAMHRLTFGYFRHHTGIQGLKSLGMLQRLTLM